MFLLLGKEEEKGKFSRFAGGAFREGLGRWKGCRRSLASLPPRHTNYKNRSTVQIIKLAGREN
ncbi:unknown protein [Desulfotalea psychrophila LSv54]|uniref:Uncharacterized protein n=1 Tax=Desulfotalea psychrophila (strain LSv54 / DSM 12343) TaxID=177439 RepID=Q6ANN9_DESPS|nr:unknown protein [Desulfotalea psychrophila LSv54]